MKQWIFVIADWMTRGLITYWHDVAVKKSEEVMVLRAELKAAQETIARLTLK